MLERFGLHAGQHPDTTAVIDGSHALSFGELDRLTSQLARKLLADGLAMNGRQPVGFCCDGHWSIVAMLGILKTGGCVLMYGRHAQPDVVASTRQATRTCQWTQDTLLTASSSWPRMRPCTASSPHRPSRLMLTGPLLRGGMSQVSPLACHALCVTPLFDSCLPIAWSRMLVASPALAGTPQVARCCQCCTSTAST